MPIWSTIHRKVKNLLLIMQVPWSPNFKKKRIELAKTENRSPKRHSCDLFINTEVTPREPVSIPFLWSFAAKLSFSLFLSSLFRPSHGSPLFFFAIDLVTAKSRIRRSYRIGYLKVYRSRECETTLGNKGRM